jgi:hypothetical protein
MSLIGSRKADPHSSGTAAWLAIAIALLAGACAFCAHGKAASAPATPVTIVFSTALVGNLEPCGCSADQLGSVARASAAIDQIRKEGHPVLVLDGGDRFFASATSEPDPMVTAQHRLQAEAMLKATELMRYDALALGQRDAWAAASLLAQSPVPVLDTGTPKPFTKPSVLLASSGIPVGVFAVGSEPDAGSVVRARAAELKGQGARVLVLLAYRTFEDARALLPVAREAGVSVVLAGRADEPETHDSAELADSQPPLFTVRARGEVLLRIDLLAGGEPDAPFEKIPGQGERQAELDALQGRIEQLRKDAIALSPLDPMAKLKTEKLLDLEGRRSRLAAAPPPRFPPGRNTFTYAFVPLAPTLQKDPRVDALIDEYTKQVGTQNLAYAKEHPRSCPAAAPGQASYVGDQACVDCHQEAYDFWKTTPHAHAYESLVKRHKQYDTSCIGCHVVGYEKPGGACDIAQTNGREAVQCESCHGAGSLHSEEGDAQFIALKVPEKQCRTCHDPENSPHFNDATYRPQIVGPGHGQPGVKPKKKKA